MDEIRGALSATRLREVRCRRSPGSKQLVGDVPPRHRPGQPVGEENDLGREVDEPLLKLVRPFVIR